MTQVLVFGAIVQRAIATQAVTLQLADEIDVRGGDLVCAADRRAGVSDQFEVAIAWLAAEPMLPGGRYVLEIGDATVCAEIGPLKYKLDVESRERSAATTLGRDEIGVANIALERQVPFDPHAECRETGRFSLLEPLSKDVVAVGIIHFSLNRASNIHVHAMQVDRAARQSIKGQNACLVWLTGLSGSGKSSIASELERKLHEAGRHTYLLDGDNLRHGLNKDLGFSQADRVENIRRVGEVAKLMVDAGLIVIAAFISPFEAERRMVRSLFGNGEFFEVFVEVPLAVAEQRDPKGLYRKARRGEIRNFTGIDSPYEAPQNPEIRIDTTTLSIDQSTDLIIGSLAGRPLSS